MQYDAIDASLINGDDIFFYYLIINLCEYINDVEFL